MAGEHRQRKQHKEIQAKSNIQKFGMFLSPDSIENRLRPKLCADALFSSAVSEK